MKSLSVVFCGQAGQGIQTIEEILSHILKNYGYNVFSTKEYMSRVRGGFNSIEIRVSNKPVRAFADKIDILISIFGNEIGHLESRITDKTLIITETLPENPGNRYMEIPFSAMASQMGNKIYSNIISAGLICGILDIDTEIMSDYLKVYFSKYSQDIVGKNIEALLKGYESGKNIISFNIPVTPGVKDYMLINGSEAVAIGSIAGGCNFISSYPMSPATGVLNFMAKNSKDFGIIVEQAEDEICAINMALGAWAGGARAMVTTSGGGFALMSEGLSLAGIMEMPLVIHLAQRPGPATGLPTRTVQGDLELALYSGHGDFPRILLAPGNLRDGVELSARAFNLADKYQVPVFILTDQYFVDTSYNVDLISFAIPDVENHFSEAYEEYKRYRLSDNGISPRGIYGYGKGLMCIDSHEHDEEGYITENFELTVKMQNKRMKKLETMIDDIIEPELTGDEDYKILIIGWGSTSEIIKEALLDINRKDIAFLHFKQVFPLHPKTENMLKKAEKIILVENNLTGQFGKLIRTWTGIEIRDKILKYNGLPFSVEEICCRIKELAGGNDCE